MMTPESMELLQRLRLRSEVALRKEGADKWSIAEVSKIDVEFTLGSGVTKSLTVRLDNDGEITTGLFSPEKWELLSSGHAQLLTEDELTDRAGAL